MPLSHSKVRLDGDTPLAKSSNARSRGHYSLVTLTRLEEVDAMQGDWTHLAGEDVMAFQSFGWNRAWIRNFSSAYEELAVFALRQNGVVVAILPCYRNGSRLRLLGDEWCDFQDVLARDTSYAEILLAEAMDQAREEGWHFDFRKLSTRGVLFSILMRVVSERGFLHFSKRYGSCPWLPLCEDGEGFLRQAKAKVRKRIRRALRRLEDLAPGHTCAFRDYGNISEKTIADLAALHERNQHRKSGESIFSDKKYCRFMLEAASSPDVGMRVIEARNQEGELIAFDLGFEAGDRFYAYLGAYDEPYSGGSPGMCLLHWQMDMLPLRKVREYDFLCGEENYKFDYATETYDIISARVYPPGMLNRLIVCSLDLIRLGKTMIKAIIRRSGRKK